MSMATEAFTVRADAAIVKRLDLLAAQLDRSRNYLVNMALEEFLDLQAWQIEKVQTGIAAAERGDFVPDEEMERLFSQYQAAAPGVE